MADKHDLQSIPGVGETFTKDLARIGITKVAPLRRADPERLFQAIVRANGAEPHPTSRNHLSVILSVIRMTVYFANGGRDPATLRWHAWADGTSGEATRSDRA